jgi:hypothetical protein
MADRVLGALVCLAVVCATATAARGQAPGGPPAAVGTIAGTVLDRASGEPIIEAGVEVVGTGRTVRTDLDGRFTVRVAPGTYQVRFFSPLHQGTRIQSVVVEAGKLRTVDVSLTPAGRAGVEVVEVIAQADRATEATQLLQRKKSAVVSDTVSAEVIRKTPGSDAGDIVQRVPAVTVKDEKFIFVRGLGERYSSAILNGSRLPSTDPQRRVVPLDLFPAEFLESINVIKSYTPDLPGDFSGGLADLRLRDFPEQPTLTLGLSTGFNTQATFRDFNTYESPPADYLGLGSGFRALPADTPDEDLNDRPPRQRRQIARSFRDIWDVEPEEAPPNTGAGLSAGSSFGPLGVQFGATYRNEWKRRRNEVQRLFKQGDPIFILAEDFIYDYSFFQTQLGAVLSTAYRLADNHKLTFRSLLNQASFDEVLLTDGETNSFPGSDFRQQRFFYSEEQLAWGQFGGEHRYPRLWLDWQAAAARTKQEQPDGRNVTRINGQFVNDSQGGLRIYNELDEIMVDSAVDLTVPLLTGLPFTDVWSGLPARLKLGPAYAHRSRDFGQRRFRYVLQGGVDPALPTEVLLQPSNIAPGAIDFVEQTLPTDQFEATEEIIAGYGMLDLPLLRDRLRLVAGVRVEYSLIRVETFDEQGFPVDPRKENVDPLPGVNLIYSPRDDMNVRVGYGRSVARPEFRELSPAEYPAPRGLRALIGNPDLVETKIESYDARWEWFFSPLELVSLSFFYKKLDQPIETVIIDQGSDSAESFENALDGEIIGFEFENRKDFGFVGPRWKPLSLLTNVTYAASTVSAPITSDVQRQTSTERQLQGQAPFIVNAALDYTDPRWGSARVLYNIAGSRIASVGSFGLPDIFEEPRHSLDAVLSVPLDDLVSAPVTAKLGIENILNDPQEYTQGGRLTRRFTTGVKFTLGVTYTY